MRGVFLGDGDGLGTYISYKCAASGTHKVEIDIGYERGRNFDRCKAAGMLQ
jgi:hypothetical protein